MAKKPFPAPFAFLFCISLWYSDLQNIVIFRFYAGKYFFFQNFYISTGDVVKIFQHRLFFLLL